MKYQLTVKPQGPIERRPEETSCEAKLNRPLKVDFSDVELTFVPKTLPEKKSP